MWDDKRVLELYIDFVVNSMKELDQLIDQERQLHRATGYFPRRKNLSVIEDGYQVFIDKLLTEWERIYTSPAHFSETRKQSGLLEQAKTVYAVSLAQKSVEQFFYHLYSSIEGYISSLDTLPDPDL